MDLLRTFKDIKTWKSGGGRAYHKPLLILLMLGKFMDEGSESVLFEDIEAELTQMLKRYGSARKIYHPEYPFWRLQNDGIWQLSNAENVKVSSSGDPSRTELIKNKVSGGFTPEVMEEIRKNPVAAYKIAHSLVNNNFTPNLSDDILNEVGIEVELEYVDYRRAKRDRRFRELILKEYSYRCAVCGYDLKVGGKPIGVEAAHVKWHKAGGPDTISNGIALCSLHHKLFDYGAFTLKKEEHIYIQVSSRIETSDSAASFLKKHHKQKLSNQTNLSQTYLNWHNKEVFK